MSLKNKQTPKASTKAPEKSTPKAPKLFVKLLKGHQFMCPTTEVVFLRDQITPVKELSTWIKFQASVGLLEIIE